MIMKEVPAMDEYFLASDLRSGFEHGAGQASPFYLSDARCELTQDLRRQPSQASGRSTSTYSGFWKAPSREVRPSSNSC